MKSKNIWFIGYANINKIFSNLGKRNNMYQPYHCNSNRNRYHRQYDQQYVAEYPNYGPEPQQSQGPPTPYQQSANPFLAPAVPLAPYVAQPKKSKKKKKTQNHSAVVMTTPPMATVAPKQTSNVEANPPQSATPGHEWVLVAKGAATGNHGTWTSESRCRATASPSRSG